MTLLRVRLRITLIQELMTLSFSMFSNVLSRTRKPCILAKWHMFAFDI